MSAESVQCSVCWLRVSGFPSSDALVVVTHTKRERDSRRPGYINAWDKPTPGQRERKFISGSSCGHSVSPIIIYVCVSSLRGPPLSPALYIYNRGTPLCCCSCPRKSHFPARKMHPLCVYTKRVLYIRYSLDISPCIYIETRER